MFLLARQLWSLNSFKVYLQRSLICSIKFKAKKYVEITYCSFCGLIITIYRTRMFLLCGHNELIKAKSSRQHPRKLRPSSWREEGKRLTLTSKWELSMLQVRARPTEDPLRHWTEHVRKSAEEATKTLGSLDTIMLRLSGQRKEKTTPTVGSPVDYLISNFSPGTRHRKENTQIYRTQGKTKSGY